MNDNTLLADLDYLHSIASLAHIGSSQDTESIQLKVTAAYERIKAQIETVSDVKIVYAFKLRRGDGKYMNRSSWDEKGKLYAKKGNLSAAIAQHISTAIEKANVAPKYADYGNSNDYMAAYRAWHKLREDQEFRSRFIPADWVVICIPINTSAPIIEMEAKEWYRHGVQDSK